MGTPPFYKTQSGHLWATPVTTATHLLLMRASTQVEHLMAEDPLAQYYGTR